MLTAACTCTAATELELACPVHPETASVMPLVTSGNRTPYWPRETSGWLSRLGSWLLDRLVARRF